MADDLGSLHVRINQHSVAWLRRSIATPGGSYLEYHREPTRSNTQQDVSLIMPYRHESYTWPSGLPPFFDMHLPEGELRAALSNRFSKAIAGFDDFDLLSIVGPHQLGRVHVISSMQSSAAPGKVDIDQLSHYEGTDDLFKDLLDQYAEYSGISGIQPKVLVTAQGLDRVTHRQATHIVKAWSPDNWPELAANEYFCLLAARLCGLEVPQNTLSENGKLLILKRFDVENDSTYLGFEDFCAISGLASARKYDGTYEGCTRLIRMMVSETQIPQALHTFYQMLVISVVLGNGDAHLKNFGMMYRGTSQEDDVWLAPTYDIVTTRVYLPKDSMALLLGGSKRWPSSDNLVRFGRIHCQLNDQQIKQIHDRVRDGVQQAANAMNIYSKQRKSFSAMAEQMKQIWLNGINNSLIK